MYGKILLLVAFSGFIYSKNMDKIKVSIFYESHCPCSTAFVSKNFYPAYSDLKQYLTVEFIPYGNTECTFQDGMWVFHCRGDHNGTACYANRVHACAVSNKLPENVTVEFVNCIITTKYTKADVENCSLQFGLDLKYMNDCTEKNVSDTLLSSYGNRTKAYQLPHIPGVIFNDVYNQTLDENARKSFRKVVCEMLGEPTPQQCQGVDRNVEEISKQLR